MLPVVHPHRCFHLWSLIEPLHSQSSTTCVVLWQVARLSVAAVCKFLIHPKSFRFVQWSYTFNEIWIESVVLLTDSGVREGKLGSDWPKVKVSQEKVSESERDNPNRKVGVGGLPYTHVQVCLKTIVRCWSFCNHSSCSYRLLWNPFLTCFQSTIGNGFQSLSSVRKNHWEVRMKLS